MSAPKSSLKAQTRRSAVRWMAYWVIFAIPLSAALFYGTHFKVAEEQFKTNARMVATLKRSQILSGDVSSAELQVRQDLNLKEDDRILFLDEYREPWASTTSKVELKPCADELVCTDWVHQKLFVYLPIYFDEGRTSKWGFLYLEYTPTGNWISAVAISFFFFVSMLFQTFGFYSSINREIGKVSAILQRWASTLRMNPKGIDSGLAAPYTELGPIEDALKNLNEEIAKLESAARSEGALATLRGVGHDILNPVTRIKRILGVLESEGSSYDTELVRMLRQNVKRLSDYAEQLKFVYRKSVEQNIGSPEFSNVSIEISNLVSELQFAGEAADRGIKISSKIEGSCLAAIPTAVLGRLAENICSNGIQASSPNSVLNVSVEKDGSWIVLGIEDQGSGISPNLMPLIFNAGFTSKGKGGTGLGLYVVKEICDQYGARVELNSSVGRGTVVRVRMPSYEVSNVV